MTKKVREIIKKISSDKLLSGSTLVFTASLGSNMMNYIFHLLSGRLLGPADYGVLASLLSLSYIIGVPGTTLATTTTKFASKYKAQGDFEAVTNALVWITKFVALFGSFIFFLGFVFRIQLAGFLKIASPALLVLFFALLVVSLLRSAPVGFLRGLLRFKSFAFISLLGTFLKLALGVGFVWLGWGVFGSIWGMFIAILVSLVFSFLLLKKNLRFPFRSSSFCWREVLSYAAPTVLVIFVFNSLYNADVVLVKHFFAPEEAGIYSSAVTMGRMIYFGLSSVGLVMFPLVSEKYENGGGYKSIFVKALLLVSLGAVFGFALYSAVPRLLVGTLFGDQYLKSVPYLAGFALFMGAFSVVNLFMQFFLSVRDFRFLPVLVATALLQLGLIWQFHASLHQVIYVNIGVTAAALVGMAGFYITGSGDKPRKGCGPPSAERG